MEFIANYGLFLAKLVTIVVAVLFIVGAVTALMSRGKQKAPGGHIELKHLNDKIHDMQQTLKHRVLDSASLKLEHKAEKTKAKADAKAKKKALKARSTEQNGELKTDKPIVYVLDFNGDMRANTVSLLREEITAILSVISSDSEVVIRLESPGGLVHAYGLAASQLQRFRDKGVKVTVCVDKVAASGGYLMACIADRIVAAPFAVLGSIGVVAQLPNFHRLLDKYDIDYEMLTAGEYKRTLTMLGKNTDKSRAKFQDDLEDTHQLFKDFVKEHRPVVDIDQVATGEVWFGRRALEKNLIDELKTSDELVLQLCDTAEVYEIKYVEKKPLQEKLGLSVNALLDNLLLKWFERLSAYRFLQ